MSYLLSNITFLRCVLNRVFQVAYLINKSRRYNARVKSHYFTKVLLRYPNIFKVF
jgi:hypothetical protein